MVRMNDHATSDTVRILIVVFTFLMMMIAVVVGAGIVGT
ncbi:hypothetical protein Mpsy_0512 [Methanolobus psychrophilus R15]|nr:hypothetical protein Mpsy_0512 [Methanolobus psychrophilus R15]